MRRGQRQRGAGQRWQASLSATLGLAFSALIYPAVAGAQDSPAGQGRQIFEAQCIACHTIGRGTLVGPDLQGVTERRTGSWLKVHIQSPSLHRQENDPVALALVEQFRIPMPDLGLTGQQAEAVIGFLATPETVQGVPALLLPTLFIGVIGIAGLTVAGLKSGSKKVEVRA